MRFFSALKAFGANASRHLLALPASLAAFVAFAWNNPDGRSWYLDIRLDKHIFCGFSWVVWIGFMRRFGAYGLLPLGALQERLLRRLLHQAQTLAAGPFQGAPRYPARLAFQDKAPQSPLAQPHWSPLKAPLADVDLSTSTDCEDLAAFSGDVLEFIEQDRSLLLDSLTDFGASALFVAGSLTGARILSSRLMKRRR